MAPCNIPRKLERNPQKAAIELYLRGLCSNLMMNNRTLIKSKNLRKKKLEMLVNFRAHELTSKD